MTELSVGNAPRVAADWPGYLRGYGAVFVRTANQYVRPRLTADQIETGWLGAGPADEPTITATERRLGIRLPPSLRDFLSATDGWKGVGGWVDEVLPCGEFEWLREDDNMGSDLIPLYTELEEEEGEPSPLLALFQRALLITAGEDLWLLDPTDLDQNGEWAAAEFRPKYGEADRYRSFGELFHASKALMIKLANAD